MSDDARERTTRRRRFLRSVTGLDDIEPRHELLDDRPSIQTQLQRLYIARGSDVDPATPTIGDALSVPAVWRAIQLISTTAGQLNPYAWRGIERIEPTPPVVDRPDPFTRRRDWIVQTMLSLALHGEAFWLTGAEDYGGRPTVAQVLDPSVVEVAWADELTGRRRFTIKDRPELDGSRIVWVPFSTLPGELRGIGPLQAAGYGVGLAAASDRYAGELFGEGGVPPGTLETDQNLSPAEAQRVSDDWALGRATNGRRPPVLSGGLSFKSTQLNPDQLQLSGFREHQLGEVARVFGIPPHLLAWSPSGSSITYGNVSALAADFLRFTLAPAYLVPVEDAWSELLPRTQRVRFDVAELLRSDRSARYASHEVALRAGFLTVDEVRREENLPPLGDDAVSGTVAPTEGIADAR